MPRHSKSFLGGGEPIQREERSQILLLPLVYIKPGGRGLETPRAGRLGWDAGQRGGVVAHLVGVTGARHSRLSLVLLSSY